MRHWSAVRGIGPWTADIFDMFCMGRRDAFAPGDLALQVAVQMAMRARRAADGRRTGRDRRALAALARRRRTPAVGLLQGGQGSPLGRAAV